MMRRIALLAALLVLAACGERTDGIGGQYELVTRIRPGSLDQVRMEVVVDFRCRHCMAFQADLEALQARYGRALVVTHHPIPRPDVAFAVRLYGVAAGGPFAARIEDALFTAGVGQRPLATETEVRAALHGVDVPEALWQLARSDVIQSRISDDYALAAAVGFLTPTLVIEGQLKAMPHRGNAEAIIDSLLQASR